MACSPGKKKFAKIVDGKCIRFGARGMRIKKSNPIRRRSFCARHKCHLKVDKATPGYQSCKAWDCKTGSRSPTMRFSRGSSRRRSTRRPSRSIKRPSRRRSNQRSTRRRSTRRV